MILTAETFIGLLIFIPIYAMFWGALMNGLFGLFFNI